MTLKHWTMIVPGALLMSATPAFAVDLRTAVQTALQLPIGSPVMLGKTAARVVRHFDKGLALEFNRTQNQEQLAEQFG